MSSLFLLKLIHDADGKFSVDDIGSVEGLDMLFELQKLAYVEEQVEMRTWVITDLGEYRLTLPDVDGQHWEQHATPHQLVTVGRMIGLQWKVSHLWEYENDQYAVWMIAPNMLNPDKAEFVHSYVLPDGMMLRYENKVTIPGKNRTKEN